MGYQIRTSLSLPAGIVPRNHHVSILYPQVKLLSRMELFHFSVRSRRHRVLVTPPTPYIPIAKGSSVRGHMEAMVI